jgi:hypothetical protein
MYQGNLTDVLKRIKTTTTTKEYGGPIDYTQYAYGGDISVPELYRAQMGAEQKLDPNANALSFPGLDNNAIMNENLSFGEPTETKKPLTPEEELLKYQRGYNQQLTYVDPKVAGESISGVGTTDKPTQQRQGTSEDYLSKKDWDKTRDNFALGKAGVLAGLDQLDKYNARKQENQLNENLFAAESQYGISNKDIRGNDDPNSGGFRPDQQGAMLNSRYGGGIYATGGSLDDEDEDIAYMTKDEIKRFLEEGGKLEYV